MGTGKDLWNQFETAYGKKDWEGVASLFAIDAVHVDPLGRHEGREAIGAYFDEDGKTFSDIRLETLQLVEEGGTVAAEWTWRATHTGPMVMPDGTEIPPTGKTIEIPAASVAKVRNGKVATVTDYWDAVGMMTQLGLMPST